ncbi:MAG: hypothetical protein DRI95_00635 [Bacteroidetes bacterium]|nr:MAG: hypothetical protein DRI95_00635 [Bacteroidota bacterium]
MNNCTTEIIGINKIELYEFDKVVRFNFPDIAKITEIDNIIQTPHAKTTILEKSATWQRKTNYSGNYKQNFTDIFRATLQNSNKEVLDYLRHSRSGFIVELTKEDGTILVFPSPVFISKIYDKKENSNIIEIELSYRVSTFKDYFTKI